MNAELCVALCALAFTFYQAWLSRHHNRLSVRPHLQWSHDRNWATQGLEYRLTVQNHGLGPARIKEVKLFVDGLPFDEKCDDPLRKMFEQCFAEKLPFRIGKTSFPARNYSLKADSEYVFVTIEFPGLRRDDVNSIEKLDLHRLDARIEYESFYGENFALDTRS